MRHEGSGSGVAAFSEMTVEAGHDVSMHDSSGEISPGPCRKAVLNSKLPFHFLVQGAVLASQNFSSAFVVAEVGFVLNVKKLLSFQCVLRVVSQLRCLQLV